MPGITIGNTNLAFQNAGSPNSNFNQWGLGGGKRFNPKGYNVDEGAFQDPNAEENKQRYMEALIAAQGRGAATNAGGAQVDPAFRQGQLDLMQQLQQQAMGQGPSLAQMQLQQGTDRNISQAAALQSSQRGANPALQQRQLQNTTAGLNQQMAGQSGQLRLQEQMQAREQLANVAGMGRQGDISQAGFNQQADLANQQSQIANQQQMDQMMQFYEGLGFSTDQASFAAQQALEQLKAGAFGQKEATRGGIAQTREGTGPAYVGMGLGALEGGAKALGMSDEREKKNIQPGGEDIYKFLDALAARSYDYKNPGAPGAGSGPQVGVMAQDMEKSPMGAGLVQDTNAGKMIGGDPSKTFGAVLAAQASLHDRLKAIERMAPQGAQPQMATEQLPESAGGMAPEPQMSYEQLPEDPEVAELKLLFGDDAMANEPLPPPASQEQPSALRRYIEMLKNMRALGTIGSQYEEGTTLGEGG